MRLFLSKIENNHIEKDAMNKLIAIVDDEPDILELVSLHLKKSGFTVKEFPDAESFTTFLILRKA